MAASQNPRPERRRRGTATAAAALCCACLLAITAGRLLQLLQDSVAVAAWTRIGDRGCDCWPENPQHLQQSYCSSQLTMKVKIVRSLLNMESSYQKYVAVVRRVFRNTVKRRWRPRRRQRVTVWMGSNRMRCGSAVIRHPRMRVIFDRFRLHRSYLITGDYHSRGIRLNRCSWAMYWPSRMERYSLMAESVSDGNYLSRAQILYLRRGQYARNCDTCQVLDGDVTQGGGANCTHNFQGDAHRCLSSHAFCGRYRNPVTGSRQCQWHSARMDRLDRCEQLNLHELARLHGVVG